MHVDLFQFRPASRGPALLALTGPWELNAHLRARAKRSGLALSQEALRVRAGGEVLSVPDEAAVFERLGMAYETPQERQALGAGSPVTLHRPLPVREWSPRATRGLQRAAGGPAPAGVIPTGSNRIGTRAI